MTTTAVSQRYHDAISRGCRPAIARAYAQAPATDNDAWEHLFTEIALMRAQMAQQMQQFFCDYDDESKPTADQLADSAADAHGLSYAGGSLPTWMAQAAERIVYGELRTSAPMKGSA